MSPLRWLDLGVRFWFWRGVEALDEGNCKGDDDLWFTNDPPPLSDEGGGAKYSGLICGDDGNNCEFWFCWGVLFPTLGEDGNSMGDELLLDIFV